jgi:beta-lactam-binding protein with PASTA domain
MHAALQGVPKATFVDADPETVRGTSIRVPDVRGLTRGQATAVIEDAGLAWRVAARVPSDEPEGRVAYTSPRAGVRLYPDQRVTIYISNGKPPTIQPTAPVVAPTTAPTTPVAGQGRRKPGQCDPRRQLCLPRTPRPPRPPNSP